MGRPGALTLREHSHPNVTLRPATTRDGTLVLEWRNDALAIRFSGTGCGVTAKEHASWLAARLADPDTHLWVAEEGSTPVGQVRVDCANGTGTVAISVSPDQRGRGVATAALRAMLVEIERDLRVTRLRALAHVDNTASVRAFERVGFRRRGRRHRDFILLELGVRGGSVTRGHNQPGIDPRRPRHPGDTP